MKGLGWVQVPRVIRRRRSSKRRCVLRTLKKGLKGVVGRVRDY